MHILWKTSDVIALNLFDKYLLSSRYLPGILPGAENTGVYVLEKSQPFVEFVFEWERDEGQINKRIPNASSGNL